MKFQQKIKLAGFTTIKLGGEAKEFVMCETVGQIKEALSYAKEKGLAVWILAGGSNTVFSDEGFDGLVIKIDLKGVAYDDRGGFVFVRAASGENWDDFVKECVKRNLAGLESLSGIPGSVGATPIQNVGAYGQEASDVIETVRVLDRASMEEKEFTAKECKFGYRTSAFKEQDNGKYIIIEVVYRLIKNGAPKIAYPELDKKIKEQFGKRLSLSQVREAVLELRRAKSMVLDPKDENSASCGSFFTNPIITQKEFEALQARVKSKKGFDEAPFFQTSDNKIKVPAAWLIEQAGFAKGYRLNGAGISDNHCLAIVNKGGTTKDVLNLANKIKENVKGRFGISLEFEPNIA